MSNKSIQVIEDAIRAHLEDEHSDPYHPRFGKNDQVIDWVVGFTVSNVIDVDGEEVVAYANVSVSPQGNPNAHIALAIWVADDISDIFRASTEE
jgi:hypothetical protein